jgi:FtsZ-interacting cell division protein ZipA
MNSKQAGGIVSFVVIGLVLAGLLGGGLYFSKQQARQARDSDTTTPQVTVNEKETETESGAAGTDEERDVPATTTPQTTPKPATPAPQAAQPQRQPATDTTNRVATTGPSDSIPATGPKETAAVISALAVITFAGYRFVDARRGFLRAALRR